MANSSGAAAADCASKPPPFAARVSIAARAALPLRLKATVAAANLGLPAGAVMDTQAGPSGAPQMLAVQTGDGAPANDPAGQRIAGVLLAELK